MRVIGEVCADYNDFPCTFHLNIAGMCQARNLMDEFGMMDDDGIPRDALIYNDGQIVMQERCERAIASFHRNGGRFSNIEQEHLRKWVYFIAFAATQGGFKVW